VAYHLHGGVGFVPYARSGTASLAKLTAERLVAGATAIVWGHHGALTLGADLDTCLDHAELLDAAAAIRLAALAAGRDASGLTPDEVAEMRRLHETPGRWEEGQET
jgi:ribulose-5-phosphate 4-epimerase/fuculose-1-phosphate aldolase